MINGHCPICRRAYSLAGIADLPTFPFCSDRCRLIDLGRWIDGAYVVPGSEVPRPGEDVPASGKDAEEE